MEPNLIIGLIVLAAITSLIIGVFIGSSVMLSLRTNRPSTIESLNISPNVLSSTDNGGVVLSCEVNNPSNGTSDEHLVQITTQKKGDDDVKVIDGFEVFNNFAVTFPASNTQMFYDGPGEYIIGVKMANAETSEHSRVITLTNGD